MMMQLPTESQGKIIFLLKYKQHLNRLKSRIEIAHFLCHYSIFRDFPGNVHDLIYNLADDLEYEVIDTKDHPVLQIPQNSGKFYFILRGKGILFSKKKETDI